MGVNTNVVPICSHFHPLQDQDIQVSFLVSSAAVSFSALLLRGCEILVCLSLLWISVVYSLCLRCDRGDIFSHILSEDG